MEALGIGQPGCVFVGLLKIVAMFDQFRAEDAHGRILLRAVAMRDDDHRTQAGKPRREGHTLTVISPGCPGF